MEMIQNLLSQQPMMALFLTIAIGYLVGEINIKGFSLGVGAVLFVALAMGWFAPKSVPAPMVGTLGLALFLYGVVVQYGKQFFIGLTSPAGVQIVALRREGRNEPATANSIIAGNDVLLATAPSKEVLAQAGKILGEAAPGRLLKDRSDLDYMRVFASRPTVVGRALGDLDL